MFFCPSSNGSLELSFILAFLVLAFAVAFLVLAFALAFLVLAFALAFLSVIPLRGICFSSTRHNLVILERTGVSNDSSLSLGWRAKDPQLSLYPKTIFLG